MGGYCFDFIDFSFEVAVTMDFSMNVRNAFIEPETLRLFRCEFSRITLSSGLVESVSGELGCEEFRVCAKETTTNPQSTIGASLTGTSGNRAKNHYSSPLFGIPSQGLKWHKPFGTTDNLD
jgi:hypothetical protein